MLHIGKEDLIRPIAASVRRPFLIGNSGYTFCNFVEVRVNRDAPRGEERGFTRASGIYRDRSAAKLPSQAFGTQTEIFDEEDAVRFTHVVGARTVTPEIIGGAVGLVSG